MDKVFAWVTGQMKAPITEIENTARSKGILCFKNIFLIREFF